jgi:hypothetical protein
MPVLDLSTIVGDVTPIETLHRELHRAGVQVEIHVGQVSPITGYGKDFCTADSTPGRREWNVYCPAGARAHSVYHELLHVEWYEIRRSYFLVPVPGADPQTRKNLAELNNDFDHANIIRGEIAAYPEAEIYWASDFTRVFKALPTGQGTVEVLQRRLTLMRGWMTLSNAMPNAAIAQQYANALAVGDWTQHAQDLATRVQAAGPNKPAAVEALRSAIQIDFPAAATCAYHVPAPIQEATTPAAVAAATRQQPHDTSPEP